MTRALSNLSDVTFLTIKSEMARVVTDNSKVARISVIVLVSAVALVIVIKSLENAADRAHIRKVLDNENSRYRKRMGIDFRVDRERLAALASKTKKNFSNDFFTNRSLFRK